MKKWFAVFLFLFVAEFTSGQQEPGVPPWLEKQLHLSFLTGNDLYAHCQKWKDDVRYGADGREEVKTSADPRDLYEAGVCSGFVAGVLSSIPVGEYFQPDQGVRFGQFVDLVVLSMRDHPESRHQSAVVLVFSSVTKAFPGQREQK